MAEARFRKISSSSKLQRATDQPLQPETIRALSEAQKCVQTENINYAHPGAFEHRSTCSGGTCSEPLAHTQCAVCLKRVKGSRRLKGLDDTAPIISESEETFRVASPHIVLSSSEVKSTHSLKSSSSLESFRTALSFQHEDISTGSVVFAKHSEASAGTPTAKYLPELLEHHLENSQGDFIEDLEATFRWSSSESIPTYTEYHHGLGAMEAALNQRAVQIERNIASVVNLDGTFGGEYSSNESVNISLPFIGYTFKRFDSLFRRPNLSRKQSRRSLGMLQNPVDVSLRSGSVWWLACDTLQYIHPDAYELLDKELNHCLSNKDNRWKQSHDLEICTHISDINRHQERITSSHFVPDTLLSHRLNIITILDAIDDSFGLTAGLLGWGSLTNLLMVCSRTHLGLQEFATRISSWNSVLLEPSPVLYYLVHC